MLLSARRLTVMCGLDLTRTLAVANELAKASPTSVAVECALEGDVAAVEAAGRSGFLGGSLHTVIVAPADVSGMHLSHVLSEAAEQLGSDDEVTVNALVVVVNVATFFATLQSNTLVIHHEMCRDVDDDRAIAEVLIEQIESADIVLLDAGHTASFDEAQRVRSIISVLNPAAHIESCLVCAFDPLGVLEHTRPSMAAARRPAWLARLDGELASLPVNDVTSFVWRSRQALNGRRFHDLLDKQLPGIVRIRGFFWLSSRPDMIGLLDVAGASVAVEPSGWWWAACPPGEWPADPVERRKIEDDWDAEVGDRMNEFVVVGCGLDESKLRAEFDSCLEPGLHILDRATSRSSDDDPFGEWDDGLEDGIRMPDFDGPPWPVMFN